MTVLAGPTDIDTIRSGFPPKPLQIEGRPSLHLQGLVYALDHLVDCGLSHRAPTQPFGKLHLVIDPTLWNNYSAQSYPARTLDPGNHPIYPANAGPTGHANIDNKFAIRNKGYTDEHEMDIALIERFYSLLEPSYEQDLRQIML